MTSFYPTVQSLELRPEVIFQILSQHAPAQLTKIIQAILGHSSFNRGHLYAAHCLRNHNSVVTTNFDNLIESACNALKIRFKRIPEYEGQKPDYEGQKEDLPLLLKIHGTIDLPEQLFLTINSIYRGPTSEAIKTLTDILRDKTALILGYSGLDQLDIMPALAASQPTRIYWFSHAQGKETWSIEQPTDPLIAALPNLVYLAGDTATLIRELQGPDVTPGTARIPSRPTFNLTKRLRGKITTDLLMHENRYHETVNFIRQHNLGRYLEFKIQRLEALGSTGNRTQRYLNARERLMTSLMDLAEAKAEQHISFIAKFAQTHEHRELAVRILRTALEQGRGAPTIIEACLELAYDFGLEGNWQQAEFYLDHAWRLSESQAEILLSARAMIIRSALLIRRQATVANPTKDIAEKIIKASRNAMSLLNSQILHDEFYYCQARNNYATGLRYLGHHKEAIDCYESNLKFFEEHSIDHTIHTLYNLSFPYRHIGQLDKVKQVLQSAVKLNKQTGRKYLATELAVALAEI